ncbi:hypothetical protein TNCV_3336651 [Trichonephila clavipes]|nr:hypothetical protein TNCV_3336651 [Trichonephila clavipes]
MSLSLTLATSLGAPDIEARLRNVPGHFLGIYHPKEEDSLFGVHRNKSSTPNDLAPRNPLASPIFYRS